MPNQPISDDVSQALALFTQQSGIEVTEHASQLIAQIIEGVVLTHTRGGKWRQPKL